MFWAIVNPRAKRRFHYDRFQPVSLISLSLIWEVLHDEKYKMLEANNIGCQQPRGRWGGGGLDPPFLADFTTDYWPQRRGGEGAGPPVVLADIIFEQPIMECVTSFTLNKFCG